MIPAYMHRKESWQSFHPNKYLVQDYEYKYLDSLQANVFVYHFF